MKVQSIEILDSLTCHVAVLDCEGTIQFVNKTWLEFAKQSGCDVNEIGAGINYLNICEEATKSDDPGSALLALSGIRQVIQGTQEKFELEYPCHPPKQQRWFLMQCSRLVSDDNLVVVSHTEITKQKLFEKTLLDERATSQTVVDALMVGIAVASLEGEILFANPTFSELYQYSTDELIGMHALKLIHPDSHKEFTRFSESLIALGHFSGNTVDVRKDGSTFHTEIRGKAVTYRGKTCLLAVVNDITDRIKAEEARKQSQELYSALFEKNKSMILLIDPSTGGIVDANPAACSYYGYSRLTLQNMAVAEINALSEEDVESEMQKAIAEEEDNFTFKHRLADGTLRDVEVFSGPIKIKNKTLLCSVIHDISARKAAEQVREDLIVKLQDALDEINKLKGILPICSHCKNIRDDQGYWQKIEQFVAAHSEAQFSHGICPDCVEKHYPDLLIPKKD